MERSPSLILGDDVLPKDTKDDSQKFGTWDGVFTSCLLNIFGVIMFLRLPWVTNFTNKQKSKKPDSDEVFYRSLPHLSLRRRSLCLQNSNHVFPQ